MEDRDFAIKFLTDHRRGLLEKRERLYRPLQEIDQEIEHVDGTLRSLQKPAVSVTASISFDFPIGKLRKLTQVQALTVIAKHYGGTFKAQEAKRLLIKAGVMRETKNSTNIIHAVIVRSDKFEKVRPGEYKLKSENQAGVAEPVRRIIRLPFETEAAKTQ
ncbi:MAG TPA: hypothetical protein VI386_11805 [Candidatus Sulfotelmatobacter sp.]